MSVYDYWIGKDINFKQIWDDYEDGEKGYVDKFISMQGHIIEIVFEEPSSQMPLFNHEAIYKTLKGCYHELKQIVLSQNDYYISAPLFLYEIDRGSAKWTFIGELKELILFALSMLKPIRDQIWFGTTQADEELKGKILDNMSKRLHIVKQIKELFPNVNISEKDLEKLLLVRKKKALINAVQKMITNGKIKSIKISQQAFSGDIEAVRKKIIDIEKYIRPNDTKDS